MEKQKTKTNQKRLGKLTYFSDVSVLSLVLSPLELKAWSVNYQPFDFYVDGQLLHWNKTQSELLLKLSLQKLDTLQLLSPPKLPNLPTPQLTFLQSCLTQQPLSARFVNAAYRMGCKRVEDVVCLGRKKLIQARGIGKISLKAFESLLKEHHYLDEFK